MAIYTIRYKDSSGKITNRKIKMTKVRWNEKGMRVFEAFCFNKEAPRTFYVDNVLSMQDEIGNEIVNMNEYFFALSSGFRVIANVDTEKNEDKYFDVKEFVQIDYKGKDGNITIRNIRADKLIESKDKVHFIEGFCLLRKMPRRFYVDRIVQLIDTDTGEVFKDPMTFLVRFKKAA